MTVRSANLMATYLLTTNRRMHALREIARRAMALGATRVLALTHAPHCLMSAADNPSISILPTIGSLAIGKLAGRHWQAARTARAAGWTAPRGLGGKAANLTPLLGTWFSTPPRQRTWTN